MFWSKVLNFWSKASTSDDREEEKEDFSDGELEIPDAHIPLPMAVLRQMYCREDDDYDEESESDNEEIDIYTLYNRHEIKITSDMILDTWDVGRSISCPFP